jgi:hypothetical protein
LYGRGVIVRPIKRLIYTSDDLNLTQNALRKARGKLQRKPNDEDAGCPARRLIALFDQGLRDDDVIGSAAAYQEALITGIAAMSGKQYG